MTKTETVIDQFNAAFRERAPAKLVDIIADDCVMEGTGPAPDGNLWRGYDECLAGWQGLATDDTIRLRGRTGRRRWRPGRHPWQVTGAQDYRGVNLIRVRDGKIVEALRYGKRP